MALSREVRLLSKKWASGLGWPKRLESLEIIGIRGWTGQRVEFNYPIVALVGENGAGKSTVLQAAASIYRSDIQTKFASYYFPDTPWETVQKASIKWRIREGENIVEGSIRKESTRWRGNPERRRRNVMNIDLTRIQPVSARIGYFRLAKSTNKEKSAVTFDDNRRARLSNIMGRKYEVASMSLTDFDSNRRVPVISNSGTKYSGFHGGAGETTMVELLKADIPKYSLVLIDEVETSLHPRSQRRLIRDLADICRVNEIQLVISTHSPFVLEELPEEARLYIWEGASGREIMKGVSAQFAMTKMDSEQHPDCDIFVEDNEAKVMLREVIVAKSPNTILRCQIIPFGAASVGQSLGQMVHNKRFPRPTCIFLDGDQPETTGCFRLPGNDAPEIVVFNDLANIDWDGIATRLGRSHSDVVDACTKAMTLDDHHGWIRSAADELVVGGTQLWQVMCAVWATKCINGETAKEAVDKVLELLS
jgi:predicted ATPase